MNKKIISIVREALPIVLMIALIPVVKDDYLLTILFVIIILSALYIRREKLDKLFFIFGFFTMILFEYLFISTGVEIFLRNSLFGVMPLWLPFLWGYGFVAIKRSLHILER